MDVLTTAIATYGGVLLSKAEENKFRDGLVSMNASITATVPATIERMTDAVDVNFTELRFVDDGLFEDGLVIGGTNRVKVKLRHQPEIVVASDGTYKVPSWNVSCPFPDTSRRHLLASEMCRKIVSLHKAAVERRLNVADAKIWMNILNDIDYADYCEQIKPPVPTTGRLVRREHDGVVVEFFGCPEEKRLFGHRCGSFHAAS